jgi:hypothetical protein
MTTDDIAHLAAEADRLSRELSDVRERLCRALLAASRSR